MLEETRRFLNRVGWPADDPRWIDEPDRVFWHDESTGLPCLARRGTSGSWCGYVAVPPEHPWYQVNYCDCPHGEYATIRRLGDTGLSYTLVTCDEEDGWCEHRPENIIDVHGGLTYSDFCTDEQETGICHVPGEDEPDNVWWFGFDCSHSRDYLPGTEARLRAIYAECPELGQRDPAIDELFPTTYKSLEYVKEEVRKLAAQLNEI